MRIRRTVGEGSSRSMGPNSERGVGESGMKLKKERIELAKETLDKLRSVTGVQQAKKDDEAEFQVPARTGRRERRGEVWSTAQTRPGPG